MARVVLVLLAVVVLAGAVVVALVLAARADDDGSVDVDDYAVRLEQCTQNREDLPVARLSLVNTSGELRRFRVEVGFFDGDRQVGREVWDTTPRLAEGERADFELVGFTAPPEGFICRVVDVSGV